MVPIIKIGALGVLAILDRFTLSDQRFGGSGGAAFIAGAGGGLRVGGVFGCYIDYVRISLTGRDEGG